MSNGQVCPPIYESLASVTDGVTTGTGGVRQGTYRADPMPNGGVLSPEAAPDRKPMGSSGDCCSLDKPRGSGANRSLVSAEASAILTSSDLCPGGKTTTYTRGKHVATER